MLFSPPLNLTEKEFVDKYNELYKKSDFEENAIPFFSIAIAFGIMQSCDNTGYLVDEVGKPGVYVLIILIILLLCLLLLLLFNLVFKIKTNRKIKNHFGMDANYVSRLYDLILDNAVTEDCLWLFAQVCRLNPDAEESQWRMIKGWYGTKESDYRSIFEYPIFMSCKNIVSKSMSYRQSIVDKLFKLAIVDDGIHNDEWNLLMDIMKQLKFNKNYVDFFLKRYRPLRTEFEGDEFGGDTSTKSIPVSQLKAYFAILGLEEGASDVEIKKAYHNLALQHHPDLPKNADRVEECETMMARINEAYEKIRN